MRKSDRDQDPTKLNVTPSLRRRLTSVVAAVALLPAFAGCADTQPEVAAAASAPAKPSPETASTSPEQGAEIVFEPIDASELKNPEQLAKRLGEVFTEVDMVGADPSWASKFNIEDESPEDYASKRVASYMPDFVATYFAGSDADPATAESLNQAELSAKQTLVVYIGSLINDPQNTAPYQRNYTVTDLRIMPKTETEGELQFTVTAEDNRLSNVGQNMLKGSDQITLVNTNKTGYVIIDGKLLFTHFDITP